jgi:hypothetical protein
MIKLKLRAFVICDNEYTSAEGREGGCTASEEFMVDAESMGLEAFWKVAERHFGEKGWKLRAMGEPYDLCPMCADKGFGKDPDDDEDEEPTPAAAATDRPESADAGIGDTILFNGETFVAVLQDGPHGMFFQPTKKDGTANKGRALQKFRRGDYVILKRALAQTAGGKT